MKIMLVGHMGRDAAAASNFLAHGHEIHVVGEHLNPSLVDAAEASGGSFQVVGNICDGRTIADLARAAGVDMLYTNSDDALAAGIVDAVRQDNPDILLPCPDKNAAQLEWDKLSTRKLVDRLDEQNKPTDKKYNPEYMYAETKEEVIDAIDFFWDREIDIAVKPCGLAGGKGVKVMGPHLTGFHEAKKYALQVIKDPNQGRVLLEEKLEGYEFTVLAYTDGKVLAIPPPTYDYPFREDGDIGPGTGGMGSFTMPDGELLPFLTQENYDEATGLMQKIIEAQAEDGRDLKGTLYGSFMMTKDGLKLIEINTREGDPEGINKLDLLDGIDLSVVLEKIANGTLQPEDVRFKKLASAVIYLVHPEYAYPNQNVREFELNQQVIEEHGCRVYHGASERMMGRDQNYYRTVGSSRTVAISALATTPWDARAMIHGAIEAGFWGPLKFRRDIADKGYIEDLARPL